MMKKHGLGRSLNALLEGIGNSQSPATMTETEKSYSFSEASKTLVGGTVLATVAVANLQPGKYQPRRDMPQEALQELADSIRSQGILQPIVVRRVSEKNFEIIAGERRWRAAQLAGLIQVPVVVKSATDEEALAIGLIENIQRQDLNAMEEARALHRLAVEFELTHEAIAKVVGRSRVAVSNLIRLLNLSEAVKTLLEHGDIEMGHARALLPLSAEQQAVAVKRIIEKGLSVRETEEWIRQLLKNPDTAAPAKQQRPPDSDMIRIQQDLSQRLNTQVVVQQGAAGKGKVVIQYKNVEALRGILEKIR